MIELKDEDECCEYNDYLELLRLQPDKFYVHLPLQIPFTKWFFKIRLQMLLMFGLPPNYFGMRHRLDSQAQWFLDWVFINHYMFDFMGEKKWKPNLTDHFRYQWLMRQGYQNEHKDYAELLHRDKKKQVTAQERKFLQKYGECRYGLYFDYARDDELAFFRMGVDSDKSL